MVTTRRLPYTPTETIVEPTLIRFPDEFPLTDHLLMRLSDVNEILRLERDAEGRLIVNMTVGAESNRYEKEFSRQLGNWWRQDRIGLDYSAGVGLRHPDGSVRSPDAAWVGPERLRGITSDQLRRYPPLCPDFVVEVRSPSDSLVSQQRKMTDVWLANGVRLGILIDPDNIRVFVYRPDQAVVELDQPDELSCDPEVPGFTIDFEEVWRIIDDAP